jgi:enoyl-[acyl-carrier protein] reductase/trans-2-enoyl-CoA reductase (NAD+)
MIVAPKIRGFICTTAHPTGCAKHVADQIAVVKGRGPIANGPKKVLVIGSSTGYGLSSRIAAAFGGNAATIGVFFEKPAEADRCGTAGWYNSAAFENEAKAAGLYARSFNGDAFSDAMKAEVIAAIKADLGQVDCVIYSLASPRRTHPKTGEVFKSVLKPIGSAYTNKNLNTGTGVVNEVTIEPANDDEIAQTVAVMGGEDWEMWIDALQSRRRARPRRADRGLQLHRAGSHLAHLQERHHRPRQGRPGARAACPRHQARPARRQGLGLREQGARHAGQLRHPRRAALHLLLYKVMKAEGTHEDCIEQMDRLFRDRLYNGHPQPDEAGRIRVDDWEMAPAVQEARRRTLGRSEHRKLPELGDFEGYQSSFLRLFGFGLEGVDYNADVDVNVRVPSLA